MDLSFGYTWPAAVALRKTKTRRFWKPVHAKKFREGMSLCGIDKDRRAGGVQILRLTLLKVPYLQPISEMPDSDYEAEGFSYLNENKRLVPNCMPYDVSWEGFESWRRSGVTPYVVEFKVEEVLPIGLSMLDKLKESLHYWKHVPMGKS